MGVKYHTQTKLRACGMFVNSQLAHRGGVPGKTMEGRLSGEWGGHYRCAHFVLNSTSLQLIPAYSSQSSCFAQLLAGVGLSESE